MGDDPEEPDPPHVDAHAGFSEAVGITDEVTVSLGYGPDRPWFEKWREVVAAFAELDGAYKGTVRPADSDGYKRLAVHFFDACFEMKDWLKNDHRIAVGDTVIDAYVTNARALRVAGDVSNTDKHRNRDSPGRQARVQGVTTTTTPPGVFMTIAYEGPSAPLSMDAHAVATDAIAEWRAFFAASGISEP